MARRAPGCSLPRRGDLSLTCESSAVGVVEMQPRRCSPSRPRVSARQGGKGWPKAQGKPAGVKPARKRHRNGIPRQARARARPHVAPRKRAQTAAPAATRPRRAQMVARPRRAPPGVPARARPRRVRRVRTIAPAAVPKRPAQLSARAGPLQPAPGPRPQRAAGPRRSAQSSASPSRSSAP